MRDIWATPPGGGATPTSRRSHLKAFVAGVLVISLGLGVGGVLRWMGASTPVSAESALEEFRARTATTGGEDEASSGQNRSRRKGDGESKKGARADKRQGGAVAASSGGAAQSQASGGRNAGSGTQNRRPAPPGPGPGRPKEGVYTWDVDGYEEAPGTRRDMPERSHRVVTHKGADEWTEHHIFSEQKEQWFNLMFSDEGVAATSVRNKVEFGPVTVDKTVVYNPPMFVARAPFELGQTWSGSWEGKTSGDYRAKTFEHTTLVIGGEEVEVWATEVVMNMRGDVEGTVLVRSWVSPEHRLVVKQYQDTRVTTGPGEYHNEWTGKLTSLHPQR